MIEQGAVKGHIQSLPRNVRLSIPKAAERNRETTYFRIFYIYIYVYKTKRDCWETSTEQVRAKLNLRCLFLSCKLSNFERI